MRAGIIGAERLTFKKNQKYSLFTAFQSFSHQTFKMDAGCLW